MITARQLATDVAKAEGHKSETRIGDIREIISILADKIHKDPAVMTCLVRLGVDRAAKKKKPVTP